MKTLKRTWADVSMDDLEHNYNAIMGHIPSGCRFLGVIKADAYGHGAVPVSQALTDLGAAYLAVSNLEEAIQIRRAGIRTPILILGYTPPEYADSMVFMDITQEVHSLEYAEALEAALSGTNYILNVHLKLDTGMTRIGFFAYGAPQTAEQLLTVCRMRHLRVEGAFTHFSVADSKAPDDVTYTKAQFARFTAMLAELSASGVQIELRHCCSSGATILYPEFALDMVRPGIATYGLAPSADAAGVLDLRPIMSLHTSVAQIRDVPAGTDVSYGRTYTTENPRAWPSCPSAMPTDSHVPFPERYRSASTARTRPSSAGSAWTCAWSTFRVSKASPSATRRRSSVTTRQARSSRASACPMRSAPFLTRYSAL